MKFPPHQLILARIEDNCISTTSVYSKPDLSGVVIANIMERMERIIAKGEARNVKHCLAKSYE
jgi:hypothetical protein